MSYTQTMDIIKNLNFLVLFLVELAMLGNFIVWGFSLQMSALMRWIVGLGTPGVVILLWGTFFSPEAAVTLAQPWNAMGEYALFGLSAAAIAMAGHTKWAITFFVVAIISETISLIWN